MTDYLLLASHRSVTRFLLHALNGAADSPCERFVLIPVVKVTMRFEALPSSAMKLRPFLLWCLGGTGCTSGRSSTPGCWHVATRKRGTNEDTSNTGRMRSPSTQGSHGARADPRYGGWLRRLSQAELAC